MTVSAIVFAWSLLSYWLGFRAGRAAAQRDARQQQPDKHADWLGADAGGSFNHERGDI